MATGDSGLAAEPAAPLFPTMRHGKLTARRMIAQAEIYRMVRRRAAAAGIATKISCHSFRATGITVYLQNGGKLEVAQQMAGHESARTTGLYDRRNDAVALDEVERVGVLIVLRMVKRRAIEAGLPSSTCCHTFRATGITAYLENGGTIENAQAIAAHESPRTTKLYDRTGDEITLDEVERIGI